MRTRVRGDWRNNNTIVSSGNHDIAVADSVATVDGPVIRVEISAGGCNERDSSWIGGQSAHIGSTAGLGLGKKTFMGA